MKSTEVDPAFLRYGLQIKDKTLVIMVDLDANSGRYYELRHRVDFEFESLSAAMHGDKVISKHKQLSFVALVEHDENKCETVYYGRAEPAQQLFEELEQIASECYFVQNDDGRYLMECLIPDEFLKLSTSLNELSKMVDGNAQGKLIICLNGTIDKERLQLSLSSLGLECEVSHSSIAFPVLDFVFEKMHRLLSRTFVALESTEINIRGIEFDLRK